MTKTLRCMKHLILTVILVCITLQTNAQQSLSYAYDAAGRFISNPVRVNHNYGYVNYNNGGIKLCVRRR